MDQRIRIAFSIVALWVAATAAGCIFQPRADEPPGSGDTDVGVSLASPENVFTAIRQSLESRTSSNYERALKSDYVFVPLEVDRLDPTFTPAVWENWDKKAELAVLQQMFGDYTFLDMDQSIIAEVNETDQVQWRVDYVLRTIRADAPTDTVTYGAVAYFYVKNDGGNWRIDKWEEIEQKPLPGGGGFYRSWGFLKGTIRQQLQGG